VQRGLGRPEIPRWRGIDTAEMLTGGAGGLGVAELWRARVYGGAATEWGMRCGGPRAVFIGRRSALACAPGMEND